MKKNKEINWENGTTALEKLVAWDFKVQAFSDVHFRINGRLDVWPTTRKWYDTRNHKKGHYPELESFVKSYFNALLNESKYY